MQEPYHVVLVDGFGIEATGFGGDQVLSRVPDGHLTPVCPATTERRFQRSAIQSFDKTIEDAGVKGWLLPGTEGHGNGGRRVRVRNIM